MNLLQLAVKQMRQRSLSTCLTLLSVLLGVALAVSIMILRREGRNLFAQTDFGYDVLVGLKGSPLQLTLNTVYHIDRSPGNIPYQAYKDLISSEDYKPFVKAAVPTCVGDSYHGLRIVGTLPALFGYAEDGSRTPADTRFEYRPGKAYEVAQGGMFRTDRFEAVVGNEVPRLAGLKLGDTFQGTHGFPAPGEDPDIHKEKWTVVGVLAQTHTANDKVVWIGLDSFYTIFEHGEAELERARIRRGEDPPACHDCGHDHAHYTLRPDGSISLDIPEKDREVSAILVKSRGAFPAQSLIYSLNLQPDVMAVNPASVMREFFRTFLEGGAALLLVISALVTLVAAASILTTIYNAVSARQREIAVLRALGATRKRILLLICTEASLVGLAGGVGGILAGHALGAAGSLYLDRTLGEGIDWIGIGFEEWGCLGAVLLLSFLAGLVPALKAYRTPVAAHLTAS